VPLSFFTSGFAATFSFYINLILSCFEFFYNKGSRIDLPKGFSW
jgi:hypothetical protein